eukprot:Nk52_evm14s370 gene=Nk52_evmTU14s370
MTLQINPRESPVIGNGQVSPRFREDFLLPGGNQVFSGIVEDEIAFLGSMHDFVKEYQKCESEFVGKIRELVSKAKRGNGRSPTQAAWNKLLDGTQAKLFESEARTNVLSESLRSALKEEVSARKNLRLKYSSDKSYFEAELRKFSDEVETLKHQYFSAAEKCNTASRDLFSIYGTPGSSRNDAMAAYMEAARVLHVAHNAYVLGIAKANAYEEAYYDKLLGCLLDNMQEFQESGAANMRESLLSLGNIIENGPMGYAIDSNVLDNVKEITYEQEYMEYAQIARQRSLKNRKKTHVFEKAPYPVIETFELSQNSEVHEGVLILNDLNKISFQAQMQNLKKKIDNIRGTRESLEEKVVMWASEKERRPSQGSNWSYSAYGSIRAYHSSATLHGRRNSGETYQHGSGTPVEEDSWSISAGSSAGASYGQEPYMEAFRDRVDLANWETKEYTFQVQYDLMYAKWKSCAHEIPSFLKGEVMREYGDYYKDDSLDSEPYFFGKITRNQAEEYLVEQGDFLVRKGQRKGAYVLSLRFPTEGQGAFMHFIFKNNESTHKAPTEWWLVEEKKFRGIKDCVMYYHTEGTAQVKLVRPIDKWNLDTREVADLQEKRVKVIHHHDLLIKDRIGKGNFGEVFRAVMLKTGEVVAAKRVSSEYLNDDPEATLMCSYQHPNIVRMIGVRVSKSPKMIVMELCEGGQLKKHLEELASTLRNTGKKPSMAHLMSISKQLAAGMQYIEGLKHLHRDIAARNCLLDKSKTIAKLCDFGMSRELESSYAIYSVQSKKLPIKWTSPEVLCPPHHHSIKSDVWSFGVLLYEIFSLGAEPYAGLTNKEVQHKVTKEGYRMPPPPNCPPEVYSLIRQCWDVEPEKRPSFQSLWKQLDTMSGNM